MATLQDLFDESAIPPVRQDLFATVVAESELLVVDAEEVQDRVLDVVGC